MKPKRVLIVDDNVIVVKALSNALGGAGYEVLTALDGAAGISSIRQKRPDLILLDITFPIGGADAGVGWDGFLIMSWLGRLPEAAGIPIVIISAGKAEEFKDRALKAGAVAYFQKPVKPDELLPAVAKILGQTPSSQPQAQSPSEPLSMTPR